MYTLNPHPPLYVSQVQNPHTGEMSQVKGLKGQDFFQHRYHSISDKRHQ